MKQTIKMLIGMVALVGATSVVTASVVKNSQSSAAEAPEPVFATAPVTAPQGGYVDLTYAAEKSVDAVAYIKVTKTGRTRQYVVRDPFSDFFGDFFGQGRGQQQPQWLYRDEQPCRGRSRRD